MAISKFTVDGVTQIDLTQDTIVPEHLYVNETALNAAGNSIEGAAQADNEDAFLERSLSGIYTANNDSFYGTNFLSGGTGGSIYVPANLLENYKAATNWSTLNSYGTVAWKTIEGSPYEHYWGDGIPMDGYQPINHMLTNSTFTGTGVTCVTNQANHVKITLADATAPVIINLTTKEIGDASVVNNLATSLFTIPASTQCKLWLTNIKNAAASDFAINFRKTGQAASASFGTGNGTHTGDLTITQTLSSAEDVSCLFVYINTPVNGTIEFDVAFGVSDNRYI